MTQAAGNDDPTMCDVTLRSVGQVEMRCKLWIDAFAHVADRSPPATGFDQARMNLIRPEHDEVFGHCAANEIQQTLDLVGGSFQQGMDMFRTVMPRSYVAIGRILENGYRRERALDAQSLAMCIPTAPDIGPDFRAEDVVVVRVGIARGSVEVDSQEDIEVTLERGSKPLGMKHRSDALGTQARALRESLLKGILCPWTHAAMMMMVD